MSYSYISPVPAVFFPAIQSKYVSISSDAIAVIQWRGKTACLPVRLEQITLLIEQSKLVEARLELEALLKRG